MKVIIDNGHGKETPGKCSPDGKIKEWDYNRRIAEALYHELVMQGITTLMLVPGEGDVSLHERVSRANRLAQGRSETVLVSIHLNAAGSDGQWHEARGFTAFVAPNGSKKSRTLATLLTQEAERVGLRGNRCKGEPYKVQSLAMCRDTRCPAVLTECAFMDNKEDAHWLQQPGSVETLARVHAQALLRYFAENA